VRVGDGVAVGADVGVAVGDDVTVGDGIRVGSAVGDGVGDGVVVGVGVVVDEMKVAVTVASGSAWAYCGATTGSWLPR